MQEVQEIWVRSLGWEDTLEYEMATHSSILAWNIPWTEELVGYSPWGCKELDMTEQLSTHTHTHTHREIKMQKPMRLSAWSSLSSWYKAVIKQEPGVVGGTLH